MATQNQLNNLYKKIMQYRKRYLRKEYSELDESATRLMVNNFFTDILGYIELEDIKTEYRIKGEYADYVIQLNRKKRMVVEVKAIQLELDEKHLRQSMNYAANEGIDWMMLINGSCLQLYRVIFSKPISSKQVLDIDLSDLKQLKSSLAVLFLLTKKSMAKDELETHWKKFQALDPEKMITYLYTRDFVNLYKRLLRRDVGFTFKDEDVLDSVCTMISKSYNTKRPKVPIS